MSKCVETQYIHSLRFQNEQYIEHRQKSTQITVFTSENRFLRGKNSNLTYYKSKSNLLKQKLQFRLFTKN